MLRSSLLTVLCAFLLTAQAGCAASPTLSVEEQDVIEAALNESKNVSPADTHVVSARPAHGEEKARYEKFAAGLRAQAKDESPQLQEAVEDFLVKDKSESELIFPRRLPSSIVLLTGTDEKKLTSGGSININWAVLRRFGNPALIDLSRPGFDRTHTTAIIYVGETTGTMSGSGSFHVLTRAQGKWHIDKDQFIGPMWIAAR